MNTIDIPDAQPDAQPAPEIKYAPPSPYSGHRLPLVPKGRSINPAGSSKARRQLKEFTEHFEKHPDQWDKMIDVAIERAHKGDYQFWNALVERLKGKVPNKNEITGAEGQPIQLSITATSPEAQAAVEALKKRLSEI